MITGDAALVLQLEAESSMSTVQRRFDRPQDCRHVSGLVLTDRDWMYSAVIRPLRSGDAACCRYHMVSKTPAFQHDPASKRGNRWLSDAGMCMFWLAPSSKMTNFRFVLLG